MKEIINKLSTYNIFNYLFPGIVFSIALNQITSFDLLQENLLVGFFVYYFIGLVISRFGSLVIEPLLRKLKFVNFVDYADFVKASKKDEKIDLYSEINNMYRTVISMIILLLGLKIYDKAFKQLDFFQTWGIWLFLIGLLVMFLLSYRKQTEYVVKRVKANK